MTRNASPSGTGAQFRERLGTNVVCVDVAGRAEEAGELQRLPTGTGTCIEPPAAGLDPDGGQDELRTEILNLDSPFAPCSGLGHIDLGQQFDGAGKDRRASPAPAMRFEFIEHLTFA